MINRASILRLYLRCDMPAYNSILLSSQNKLHWDNGVPTSAICIYMLSNGYGRMYMHNNQCRWVYQVDAFSYSGQSQYLILMHGE